MFNKLCVLTYGTFGSELGGKLYELKNLTGHKSRIIITGHFCESAIKKAL